MSIPEQIDRLFDELPRLPSNLKRDARLRLTELIRQESEVIKAEMGWT